MTPGEALSAAPAVRCAGLAKSFDGTEAVLNASFDLPAGAVLALLGPSGCGKTTILRMIAGFESPDAGTIELEDHLVAGPGHNLPPEQRRVGMVFQDYALFPNMSVRANVGFGISKAPDRDERVEEVLDLVGLAGTGERMPHQLSGGQQQRVALARALAPRPTVVLLDEPFSNLDAALRGRVRNEVRQILRRSGTSAVFVTHDQDEAFALADLVGVMLDHRVVQVGTPEEVYLYPLTLEVAAFLGVDNILEGTLSGDAVTCELGTLETGGPTPGDGPVTVAIRPQTIRLEPAAHPGVTAEVISREFHGTYKDIKLRLPSGAVVRAIMGLHIPADVGDQVTATVNSYVSVYHA